jgi:predicted DNA-binding protein (UPF0251 family)
MMGRPIKCRKICCQHTVDYFEPQCVSLKVLEEIVLGLDEIEAIRLADLDGLYQADAASLMGVSRQTFGSIITQARKKIAAALIGGKALRIGSENRKVCSLDNAKRSGKTLADSPN